MERIEAVCCSGVKIYRFAWPPGTVHAFTTRQGGYSLPPFDGLNLGDRVGDDLTRVRQNRRLVAGVLGLNENWVMVNQVNGDRIIWVQAGEPGDRRTPEAADGIATEVPGIPLVVFGADCGLLLFYDPAAKRIGAVHAGWRGTLAGLPRLMAGQFIARGSRPKNIYVGIGPCIGPCCYLVGPEVWEAFAGKWSFADQVTGAPAGDKRPLDLALAQRLQLIAAGLPSANIFSTGFCTACRPAEFFSYRRDGGKTGRQAAMIMLSPAASGMETGVERGG
ncbi:MAG: peptidoglycan editing factor PgeF [Heliobacteriaceae bacterium]|nr:peptidoglycan editing factor PgeF [Heliobacteriaceae bacterium]